MTTELARPPTHALHAWCSLDANEAAAAVSRLVGLDPPESVGRRNGCSVATWAASGGMHLTGRADGPPWAPTAPVGAHLAGLCRAVEAAAAAWGRPVDVDLAAVVSGRAALHGFTRAGDHSSNGTCRLLAAADGWVAVNLARPVDADSLPAVVGDDPLDTAVASMHAADVVERAQSVGIPAAVLGGPLPRQAPVVATRAGATAAPPDAPLVVDLSALWAGPLCARILGQAGCRVVKVESTTRPDSARQAPAPFFDWLHGGHESVCLDFGDDGDRRALQRLVDTADVVLESSRPRALAQLGVHADRFVGSGAGRTWVSVTGYGRQSTRVAFGDDAAVAGGLVAVVDDAPVFCADAVADPVSGLFAALAALASLGGGGGRLLDIAMAAAAGYVVASDGPRHHHDVAQEADGTWTVAHDGDRHRVALPVALEAAERARPLGADTDAVLASL